jgi:hypothetical protein
MPTLANKRHEKFARAIASGMPAATAYRRHIARSRDGRHIYENACHLKNRVFTRIRIAELREKLEAASEDAFISSKKELMVFLTRIIRTTPAELEADQDLVQEARTASNDGGTMTTIKMLSKLDAANLLAKLAGYFSPERVEHSLTHTLELSPALRMLEAARMPAVHALDAGEPSDTPADEWQPV